jgi:hypothetical protein
MEATGAPRTSNQTALRWCDNSANHFIDSLRGRFNEFVQKRQNHSPPSDQLFDHYSICFDR